LLYAGSEKNPMQNRYTLYYFNIRGRGEQIRLILTHLGIPFEDKALDRDAWRALKPSSPLGQMPYAIEHTADGDLAIPQSMAIVRHLAREHGVYGSNAAERLATDVAADTVGDLRAAFSTLRFSAAWNDPVAKQTYATDTAPSHLQRIAKLLGARERFAGATLTFADFTAFEALDTHAAMFPGCLEPFPTLAAFVARMRALPTLQTYLQTQRPAA
jgi:glutathione S-transferase